mmetsp:Transcript_36484/g.58759  ORF Transcript_36484/g.58759 Transcript_36484/m.58759 type:complete len:112 (-) Transcript_36484:5076-5411(-)
MFRKVGDTPLQGPSCTKGNGGPCLWKVFVGVHIFIPNVVGFPRFDLFFEFKRKKCSQGRGYSVAGSVEYQGEDGSLSVGSVDLSYLSVISKGVCRSSCQLASGLSFAVKGS